MRFACRKQLVEERWADSIRRGRPRSSSLPSSWPCYTRGVRLWHHGEHGGRPFAAMSHPLIPKEHHLARVSLLAANQSRARKASCLEASVLQGIVVCWKGRRMREKMHDTYFGTCITTLDPASIVAGHEGWLYPRQTRREEQPANDGGPSPDDSAELGPRPRRTASNWLRYLSRDRPHKLNGCHTYSRPPRQPMMTVAHLRSGQSTRVALLSGEQARSCPHLIPHRSIQARPEQFRVESRRQANPRACVYV